LAIASTSSFVTSAAMTSSRATGHMLTKMDRDEVILELDSHEVKFSNPDKRPLAAALRQAARGAQAGAALACEERVMSIYAELVRR
jgi:hypothetical protein